MNVTAPELSGTDVLDAHPELTAAPLAIAHAPDKLRQLESDALRLSPLIECNEIPRCEAAAYLIDVMNAYGLCATARERKTVEQVVSEGLAGRSAGVGFSPEHRNDRRRDDGAVTFAKAARLRHCSDSVEARGVDGIADHVGTFAKPSSQSSQAAPLRAELIGDACTAAGLTVRGSVLGLCRELVTAGIDPSRPLHCYRGAVLSLIVRQIGEGARLRIATHGVGFERLPECTESPPVRQNAPGGIRPRADDGRAP